MLREIRKIITDLDALKIQLISYFIESTYKNSQNRELPFQINEKGCELYGTRMTGAKGTQFAVAYIERFNQMEEHLKTFEQPSYMISDPIKRAEKWIQEYQEKEHEIFVQLSDI